MDSSIPGNSTPLESNSRAGTSTWLQCCYCRFSTIAPSTGPVHDYLEWMTYPCGWWERHPIKCECSYIDRLGSELRHNTPFCIIPRYDPGRRCFSRNDLLLIQSVQELRIDCVHEGGLVQFTGRYHDNGPLFGPVGDPEFPMIITNREAPIAYSDAEHGLLMASNIISVRPFRKMNVIYFVTQILPKVRILKRLFIVKSLHYSEIKRLSSVNTATIRLLRSASGALQARDFMVSPIQCCS